MAHITALTATKFARLDIFRGTNTPIDDYTDTELQDLFEDSDGAAKTGNALSNLTAVTNIREFPSVGTPANITNVPVYGESISSSVGAQADAPTLEFTINYVPNDHQRIESLRENATVVIFRIRMTDSAVVGENINYGLGNHSLQFNDVYFRGRIESFEVTPSLSDAMQASFTCSISGAFRGFYSASSATAYGPPTLT